jgi:predicted dehydrogenase
MQSRITRRRFNQGVAVGAGLLASRAVAGPAASPATSPSQPVRVGFIGVGNRGDQVLNAFLAQKDTQIVALCDLYQPYLDAAARKVAERSGTPPKLVTKDYRRLLDSRDVDAVVVATPDHWHALQTVHACRAGKDVYVEKPLSLTVAEGRAMVDAARQHKRVVQVGIQRRSSPGVREMIDFLRGGGIGAVTVARAFHLQNESPHGIGRPKDGDPPADLDWDAWVGPAPMKPYNPNRTLYRFRWFYDYSGGQMTNTGAHYLDLIRWALGDDDAEPISVAAMGGKFADFDNREVPDTLEAMWTFRHRATIAQTLVTFSQFNANDADASAKPCEIEFRGTKGTVYYRGSSFEVVPETGTTREYPILSPLDRKGPAGWRDGKPVIESKLVKGTQGNATPEHARNFLDCVRSRKQCVCDIETGHRSTSATIIANIAHRTRSLLDWDAKAERFTNNDDANKLLSYTYRKPYELPLIGTKS